MPILSIDGVAIAEIEELFAIGLKRLAAQGHGFLVRGPELQCYEPSVETAPATRHTVYVRETQRWRASLQLDFYLKAEREVPHSEAPIY